MSKSVERIMVSKPNIEVCTFRIIGTAPLVMHNFSKKVMQQMLDDQVKPGAKKKTREPKDPQSLFEQAIYRSEEGWCGIHAPSFRLAMIRACSLVGYTMTMAKMSVFILHDGLDAEDGSPLVRIIGGEPELHTGGVTLQGTKKDIRIRPMWRKWEADVTVQYDADQFSRSDIANLLMRAGVQVGIGEGRPSSKNSAGCGWGTFKIQDKAA